MKKIILCLSIFLIAGNILAENKSGARFLGLGVGARELGMGGVSAAVSGDVNSSYWNPAGLSQISGKEFGLTHSEWLVGSQYDFLGFAIPVSKAAMGIQGILFSQPQQEGRDENRTKLNDFSASDMVFGLSGAIPFNSRFSVGTTVKYLESRIGSSSARGVSMDAGSQIRLGGTQLGLSIRNAGPSFGFESHKEPLPTNMAVGIAHTFFKTLLVSSEYSYDIHANENNIVLGSEFNLVSSLMLRAGYLSHTSNGPRKNSGGEFMSIAGLVGGMGIRLASFNVDYAFTPFGEFGQVHRISLIAKYGLRGRQEQSIVRTSPPVGESNIPSTRVVFEMPSGWQTTSRVYIVKEGETLKSIAQDNFGQESFWRQILVANPLTIQDPEKLVPGQRIFIPQK